MAIRGKLVDWRVGVVTVNVLIGFFVALDLVIVLLGLITIDSSDVIRLESIMSWFCINKSIAQINIFGSSSESGHSTEFTSFLCNSHLWSLLQL